MGRGSGLLGTISDRLTRKKLERMEPEYLESVTGVMLDDRRQQEAEARKAEADQQAEYFRERGDDSQKSAGIAFLAFVNGNDLLGFVQYCDGRKAVETASDSYLSCGYFSAYAVGVLDTYNVLRAGNGFELSVCLPSGVTQGQLKAIAQKYLEDNPATLHLVASTLVLRAYQEAFPCP